MIYCKGKNFDIFEDVKKFKAFPAGAVVYGGHFGDEGKGKIVDILSSKYKKAGYKVLSARGQGSGNAGHTVIVDGEKYDFHYLTSAGLSADLMLLGAGMLLDPIRVLEESEKLPEEKRKIIVIDERATISCELDRAMDQWLENQRAKSGKEIIGTTKSGVGPAVAWRAQRDHVTFADCKNCNDSKELYDLFNNIPNVPDDVKKAITEEYANDLFEAVKKLNIVNSQTLITECREEGNWAVLLEVSQAMSLDPLWGNGCHYVTSTHCSPAGAIADAGFAMEDFPDGYFMVLKAYASKVGNGPFITKLEESEKAIDDYIHDVVGECGVTTGRKRDLGWFDGPAVRMAIARSGNVHICINCMDVIGNIPGNVAKICYAYKEKSTGKIVKDLPCFLSKYDPVYFEIETNWDIYECKEANLLPEGALTYIEALEKTIGAKIEYIGTGGSNLDIIKL